MYKGVKKEKMIYGRTLGLDFMTSRICRDGGSFFIVSNDSSLLLSSTGKEN